MFVTVTDKTGLGEDSCNSPGFTSEQIKTIAACERGHMCGLFFSLPVSGGYRVHK